MYNDYFSDNFRGGDFKCFFLYALLYIYIFSILILYDIFYNISYLCIYVKSHTFVLVYEWKLNITF